MRGFFLVFGMAFVLGMLLAGSLAGQVKFRLMEYNVENLFDCEDDSLTQDNEFLPEGSHHWNQHRYYDKLNKIGKVIAATSPTQWPDLVVLCEVENDRVIEDLTQHSPLRNAHYRFFITHSQDVRGIDVALLYQRDTFKPLSQRSIRLPRSMKGGRPTRDILHVTGLLFSGDTLDLFACHMPSRAGGKKVSEPYRRLAASILKQQVDSVMAQRQTPNILLTGDFNDYPQCASLQRDLGAARPQGVPQETKLYNLMDGRKGEGTYRYQGEWGILDQLIVNGHLLQPDSSLHTTYEQAQILKFPFLLVEDKKYGGFQPFRTYLGPRYLGGYSDHLPVLLELELRVGWK
jgi:predicted extracellular nuclease